jgi:hypothetical protein
MHPWQRKHAINGRPLVIATDTRTEMTERIFTPEAEGDALKIAEVYRRRGWKVDHFTRAEVARELATFSVA